NENRNMSELFQETKELNELMKSYIRVHMNEEMAKEVTIHNQLNQIQEKSDKVMSNMQPILNTKGKTLEENAENLQANSVNGQAEMEKNNNKTVKAGKEMQKSSVEQLNQINNEISTSMTNIKRNLNETVKKGEQESRDLVSNAKHGTLVTSIIDTFKYGADESEFTIPVIYLHLSYTRYSALYPHLYP